MNQSPPPVASESTLRSLMIAVATAQFLLPFMMSGIGPLLPTIGRDLDASAMELGLVGAIYSLSLSIFHLVSGRIGDMKGRRKLFLVGLGIFLAMSIATPFSPNMTIFLCCRFVQAIGTAMMNTSALSILIASAPPAIRGRVLGVTSIGLFAGVSSGPAIGGFIGSFLGWHYLFFCVVPLGVIAWLLMAFTVKGDWTNAPEAPFDWRGSILYSLGICAISMGATWILSGSWAIGLVAGGFLLLILFAFSELKRDYPILDVKFVVRNTSFLLNVIISFIVNSSAFGLIFYYSLYLQGVQGLNVLHTGMVLSVQPVVQLVCAPWTGKLAGPARPAVHFVHRPRSLLYRPVHGRTSDVLLRPVGSAAGPVLDGTRTGLLCGAQHQRHHGKGGHCPPQSGFGTCRHHQNHGHAHQHGHRCGDHEHLSGRCLPESVQCQRISQCHAHERVHVPGTERGGHPHFCLAAPSPLQTAPAAKGLIPFRLPVPMDKTARASARMPFFCSGQIVRIVQIQPEPVCLAQRRGLINAQNPRNLA